MFSKDKYKYLKYKNKYLNLAMNQTGGALDIVQSECSKIWWNNNGKYKTGDNIVGFNPDGTVNDGHLEKLQFIDNVVNMCKNYVIDETHFNSRWGSYIIRKQIQGTEKWGLYYNNDQLIQDSNYNGAIIDGAIIVKAPAANPHVVGTRVKFSIMPKVQGHGGGVDFTGLGIIQEITPLYFKLKVLHVKDVDVADIEAITLLTRVIDKIRAPKFLNKQNSVCIDMMLEMFNYQPDSLIYVRRDSWYNQFPTKVSSEAVGTLAPNENSYMVIMNPDV